MPPYVVSTVPDTFALVEPGIREFEFRFSERISERPARGVLEDAVIVSPELGNARVRHRRQGLSIRVQEPVQEGRVYRVTVLPAISDMFQNALRDPFDLVFTTGPEIIPNVVGGFVEDRATGEPRGGARVEAVFADAGDSAGVVHWNPTDEQGVFFLRFAPDGPFNLRAWVDQNRNGELDEDEPRSAVATGELDPALADTSFSVLSLIAPDSLGAIITEASLVDSLTVRLTFDDYLDPLTPLEGAEGRIRAFSGGDELTAGEFLPLELVHAHEYAPGGSGDPSETATEEGAEELAADSAVEDQTRRSPLSGLILPAREIYALLDPADFPAGLPFETLHQVVVKGLVNLAGTLMVEDSAPLARPRPVEAADTLQADTLQADTLQADTLQADTASGEARRTPPDSTSDTTDTLAVRARFASSSLPCPCAWPPKIENARRSSASSPPRAMLRGRRRGSPDAVPWRS